MKTDAEILALFGFMYTSIAFDNGKPVTNNGHYKVTPSEAVAIYRRAFRDGAEAAIRVREELMGTNQGAT